MNLELGLPLRAVRLSQALDLALAAEGWGYGRAWTEEVDAFDAFTPLAWLAARSASLRLGVGLAAATSRPTALLAMTAAGVDEASSGRLTLTIGASTPTVLEQWFGLSPAPALTAVRETVELLRLLFTGEMIDYPGGVVRMTGFQLRSAPREIPIWLGAHSAAGLRLAGEIADGVLLGNTSAEWIPQMRAEVGEGAAKAGRAAPSLICRVVVAPDEDLVELEPQLRRSVAFYASAPSYQRFFSRMGFAMFAQSARKAWESRDGRAAAALVPDDLLNSLFVLGTLDDCARRLRRFAEVGCDTVVVVPASAVNNEAVRAERIASGLHGLAARLTSR